MLRIILILVTSLSLLTACGNKDVIPENDMVKILTKMYLIDGTNSMSNVMGNDRFSIDSVDHYSKMLETYGFTTQQFSKSYYYYLGRPEILDGIYDKVIAKLEVESQQIQDSIAKENDLTKYWYLSSSWTITGKESNEKIEFSLPTPDKKVYTLKMIAVVGKDDETPNLRMIVGTTEQPSCTVDKLDNKQIIALKKTGVPETYIIKIAVPENKGLFIKGRLLDFTPEPSKKYVRNVIVRRITLNGPKTVKTQKPVLVKPPKSTSNAK